MQITITQPEIEKAIKQYLGRQLTVSKGVQMKIDMRATRGDIGFSAIIDIFPGPEIDEVEEEEPAVQSTPTPPAGGSRPFFPHARSMSRAEETVLREEVTTALPETHSADVLEEATETISGKTSDNAPKDTLIDASPANGASEYPHTRLSSPNPVSTGRGSLFKSSPKPKN